MGRPGDALARTEAVAVFNASGDRIHIASRAAGQDAGVAGQAVMAWSLWFVGYPDRAEKQMTAALGRADEIAHPHTQAYGLYYASILSILRGEFTSARLHAERCLSVSEAHGLGCGTILRGLCVGFAQTCSTLHPRSWKTCGPNWTTMRTAANEWGSRCFTPCSVECCSSGVGLRPFWRLSTQRKRSGAKLANCCLKAISAA